jgi:chemotaxis protein CheX
MMTTTPSVDGVAFKHHECIGESAAGILNATCGISLSPQDDKDVPGNDVLIAVISLVGSVEWSIFLGLPRLTACALAAKFAGFEIPFESGDMGDAVGELANILAGDIKNRLDAKGVKANISLPTVIRAQDIHVLIQRNATAIKTCYRSELGSLWVGVTAGKGGGFVV